MFKAHLILSTAVFCLSSSCSSQKTHTKMEAIRSLAKKCDPVETSFKWNVELDAKRYCVVLNPVSTDSFLLRELNMQVVGKLNDTSSYFGFITLSIGDMLCPELSTFSKDGSLISRTRIANCHCGGLAMGYESCYDSLTIDAQGKVSSISKAIFGPNQIDEITDITCNMTVSLGQIHENGKVDFHEGDLQLCDN